MRSECIEHLGNRFIKLTLKMGIFLGNKFNKISKSQNGNFIKFKGLLGIELTLGIKSINKVELCKAHLILNLFSGSKSNDRHNSMFNELRYSRNKILISSTIS